MLSPFLNARLQFSVHESVLEKPWILVKMNIPASALRLLLGRESAPAISREPEKPWLQLHFILVIILRSAILAASSAILILH